MADTRIRPAQLDEIWKIHAWRNAPRVRQAMLTQHEIGPAEHESWFERKLADPSFRQMISEDSGTSVSVQAFFNVQLGHSAWWAFYFTDAVPDDMPTMLKIWKGVELSGLAYAFEVLGLRTLYCEVLLSNTGVRQWHKRFSFVTCDPNISTNTANFELEVLKLDRAAYEKLRAGRSGQDIASIKIERHPFDIANLKKEQSA